MSDVFKLADFKTNMCYMREIFICSENFNLYVSGPNIFAI